MKSIRIEPADNGYILYPSGDDQPVLGLPHLAENLDEVHSYVSEFFGAPSPEDSLRAFGDIQPNLWDEELA